MFEFALLVIIAYKYPARLRVAAGGAAAKLVQVIDHLLDLVQLEEAVAVHVIVEEDELKSKLPRTRMNNIE